MRARAWIVAAVAVMALTAGVLFGHWRNQGAAPPAPSPEVIYGQSFPDLSGQPQALGRWRGQVVVLNFWATWCPPCRAEMPEFIAVQREYAGRGFTFVGVALDESEAVGRFAAELGVNYPILLGGAAGAGLARTLGSRGALPFSVVLDRQGRVRATHLGALTRREVAAMIADVL